MGRTTDLRREIKRPFFPVMADKGLALDMDAPFFVCFRRTIPGAIHVCDIQWEKYGRPRFVINFGKCAPAGDLSWPADRSRRRLAPGGHSTVGGWFRQDRPLIESILYISRLRPQAEVITMLLGLFHEVEEWWEDGSVGPHVHVITMRYSRDVVEG
jgi:hypothetical protein